MLTSFVLIACGALSPLQSERESSPADIAKATADRLALAARFAELPLRPSAGPDLWDPPTVEGEHEVAPDTQIGPFTAGAIGIERAWIDVAPITRWALYGTGDLSWDRTDLVVERLRYYVPADRCDTLTQTLVEHYGEPANPKRIWDAVSYEVRAYRSGAPYQGEYRCVLDVNIVAPDRPPSWMWNDVREVHWYRPRVDSDRRIAWSRAWDDAVRQTLLGQPLPRYPDLTDADREELRKAMTALVLPFEAPDQWLERPPPPDGRLGGPAPPPWPWALKLHEPPAPR